MAEAHTIERFDIPSTVITGDIRDFEEIYRSQWKSQLLTSVGPKLTSCQGLFYSIPISIIGWGLTLFGAFILCFSVIWKREKLLSRARRIEPRSEETRTPTPEIGDDSRNETETLTPEIGDDSRNETETLTPEIGDDSRNDPTRYHGVV